MTTIGLTVRIALGCIFLISATGKFWDNPGTRQALSDFGVPDALIAQGARTLPLLELLVGVGLLSDVTYRMAASTASVLSVLFMLGIANLLRQGRTPPCHCFGVVQSAPVGIDTFARAAILAIASLTCAYMRPLVLTPDMSTLLAAACLALLTVSIASNIALWTKLNATEVDQRVLTIGQRIPALRLLEGKWLSETLRPETRNLIIVTTPGCGPCKSLKTQIDRWARATSEVLQILELEIAHTHPAPTTTSHPKHYASDTEVNKVTSAMPSALLVDGRGVLLAPPIAGPEQIEALLRATLAERAD